MTEQEQLEAAQKRYRRLSKPICPKCNVECLCESTKDVPSADFKVQYRYCPICRHPAHKIIPK